MNKSKDNIILIGFMGSAKTTVGKLLSQKLNRVFIDSDQAIENKQGKTIQNIFKENGEEYFRKLENEFLLHSEFQNSIISTGGGMPCHYDNMKIINQLGITIYLYATPKELARRLEHSKKERPLLNSLKGLELIHYIEQKLEERKSFYEKSKIHLDTSDYSQNEVVNKIVEILEKMKINKVKD